MKNWISSSSPLIRLAAAQVGYALPESDRKASYLKLLEDEFKAVRLAAANHLLPLQIDSPAMFSAVDELITSAEQTRWRGEGGLNLSLIRLNAGHIKKSISSLQHAIKVDPYFDAAYVNLAEMYRRTSDNKSERKVLENGLSANPGSGSLRFSYAMYLIRQNKKNAALEQLQQAIQSDPANIQVAYVYFIALDDLGKTRQALTQLIKTLYRYNDHPQLIALGLKFAQKVGDKQAFDILSDKASRR